MCGITGFVNFNKNIKEEFEVILDMNNTLYHRGPNDYGYYYRHNHALFGHRRLSIVDKEGGVQPMTRVINGNRYTIVYNGEIYNTKDIKKDLEHKGYEFLTYSDTEVLLLNYIHYKEEGFKRLNGIFAFSILDEERDLVILARDHLGVKPLFYSLKDKYLIFSSEIKGVLANPLISREVDREGLLDMLSLGPSRSPHTGIFKDIKEVPPANYLIFNKKGHILKEYWSLEPKEYTLSERDTVEYLSSLFQDIIKNQLVSDRGVFSFLSGGIDSSLISSIVSSYLKDKGETLDTFTVDYVDYDKDFKSNEFEVTSDKHFVKIVDKHINSNNRIITIKNEDLFYSLKDSLYASDMPSMADVDTSLYLFCKGVKDYGVVGLSGECADEIFGGYPWYTNKEDLKLKTFPWNRFSGARMDLFNDKVKSLDFNSYTSYRLKETLDKVKFLDSDTEEDKNIRRMTMLNIKWFMVTLLNRKDRMSMANSLEIRVPFADKDLVEFSYNLPAKIKFLNGREKGILREVSKRFLPKEVVERKKSPYPKTQSEVYMDLVSKELLRIIEDKKSPILNLINKEKVKELILSKGSSYTKPWFGQLMRAPQLIAYLICLNMWLDKYNVSINI